MKTIIILMLFLILISGCYTMIDHPEVEVYYERENGEEYLTEDYDVFVDEDCSSCHEAFLPQTHFSPLLPAHNTYSNWNNLPWWLDTKYLMFFSKMDSSESGSYGYQHVNSQNRNINTPAQAGGYIPASRAGGSSSSSGSTTAKLSPPQENPDPKSRKEISSQDSGNSSRSASTSSKRKGPVI